MLEIEIFWEGILRVKANGKKQILTNKPFPSQNPSVSLGQWGGGGFTLTGVYNVHGNIHYILIVYHSLYKRFINATITILIYFKYSKHILRGIDSYYVQ